MVFRNLIRKKSSKPLLIGVEGTKTPVGNSGKAETPQRASVRRLSVAPRKAKCLQRKSTPHSIPETNCRNPSRRNLISQKLIRKKSSKPLLIGVEGTKTPVGDSGKAETPQRASFRRLNSAPRKAKCLQRKSTPHIKAETICRNRA